MLFRMSYRLEQSSRYRRVLSRFHPDIEDPTSSAPKVSHPIPIFGFSATFSRHDGLALGSVFERIVYHRDFLEMIKEQWYIFFFLNVEEPSLIRKIRSGCVMCDLPASAQGST